MSRSSHVDGGRLVFDRRQLMSGLAAGTALTLSGTAFAQGSKTGVDATKWTPEYIKSIAGTETYDTAAECYRVVPREYKGKLTYWYFGPTQASPQIEHEFDAQFWTAFKELYPNIQVTALNLNYNEMIDKLRTAAIGKAAPMVVRLPILAGVEFAAKNQLMEFGPEMVGYSKEEFWPGAMKSVTWKGKTYGVPTNNETMALIWNADLFKQAGLDPEAPPKTWDDLVSYSRQIKEKTGKNGYGMVARVNAGNTPFRFMPQLWAYGGGALDEAEAEPNYKTIFANKAASKKALQASYDMYVRDKSVPVSALTNTQNENQDPFIAGNLGMMIAHPSEYAFMLDRAKKATGDDKKVADAVVANMRYGRSAPRRGVRRFERPCLPTGHCGRRTRRQRRQGDHRLRERAGMVDEDGVGQLEPRQSARVPYEVDEGAAGYDQVSGCDDVDAAQWHSVPRGAAGAGDYEHHYSQHAAERTDAEDVGGCCCGRRRKEDQGASGGSLTTGFASDE
jgi:ABC-type glycerol-3-phosphate transport system substrate-binding protein